MEISENKEKVWGIVAEKKGNNSARIKIFAREEKGFRVDFDIKESFPPYGYVFANSFFEAFPSFLIGTIIQFYAIPNFGVEQGEGRDEWKLDPNLNPKPKPTGFRVFETQSNPWKTEGVLDLGVLEKENFLSEIPFLIFHNEQFIGPLKSENGKIFPTFKKEVKIWKSDSQLIYSWSDNQFILEEPKTPPIGIADSMDGPQLQKWFLEKVKPLASNWIKELDSKTNWRIELSGLLENNADQLFNIRLKRIINTFDTLELDKNSLIELSKGSQEFQAIFERTLLSMQKDFKAEIQSAIDAEKENLKTIERSIQAQKDTLEKIEQEIISQKTDLKYIEQNRARLIQDFKLFTEINSGVILPNIESAGQKIQLSSIEIGEKPYSSSKQFFQEFQFHLQKLGISNKRIERQILGLLSNFRCIFIPDTRVGVALARAIGKTKFIIQQVEPDWIKFEFCWRNGLSDILDSCLNFPNQIHLLIIQDINLASPECWARPLLDMNLGIRDFFPNSKYNWPSNLWILCTKQPAQEPENIGLPLFGRTFEGWAGLAYSLEPAKEVDSSIETSAYLTPELVNISWKVPISEINYDEIKHYIDIEKST
ncbi:MAG: hypothetical protein H6581_05470 [Bacteroidia bacterium]|nr:hypothetical protein [Bacteroidia bacterium]